MDRADVRMVQRRGGLRFAPQPLKRQSILFELVGQKFQRDTAGQPRIVGRPNHAHASVTDLFDDAVVRNDLPDHESSLRYSPNEFAPLGKRCGTKW